MNIFFSKLQFVKKTLFVFFIFISYASTGQEICNNGIDDDLDGLIDLNDSIDCVCGVIKNTSSIASLIPNSSFEVMSYCPNTYSQLDAATGWVQATDATTDYYNCGFIAPEAITAGLLPYPDGNGIIGAIYDESWKEYVGTCLNAPMLAGISYQFNFNVASTLVSLYGNPCNNGNINNIFGPVDITIFGSTNCNDLPVSTLNCPTTVNTNWMNLGSISYTPSASWNVVSIIFTPTVTINTIMFGPPCNMPSNYPNSSDPGVECVAYLYYDNLILNKDSLFSRININSTGHYCSNDLVLESTITTSLTSSANYQWYLNGVAISGATNPTYNVPVGNAGIGTYLLKIIDGTYCGLSNKYQVTANGPTIAVTNASICPSSTGTLSAYGSCTTYTWSNGSHTQNITVSSPISTTYTITGSLGTCTSQAIAQLVVFSDASISVTGNTLMCVGDETTLTVHGANNYFWTEPSNSNTLGFMFSDTQQLSPGTTTTYTVEADFSSNGDVCTFETAITVNVITTPIVHITPLTTTICPGSSVILSVSGANTYTWTNGLHTSSITVNPITNTNYTVLASVGSCTAETTANVFINNTLSIAVNSATICNGNQVLLQASGASTYTWNTGQNTSSISVAPTTNINYTVYGSLNTCTATATATVLIDNGPNISVNSSTLCAGQTATLTANGANTYTWSNGSNNSFQIFSPLITTTYTVSGTNTLNCNASITTVINVEQPPAVNFTGLNESNYLVGSSIELINTTTGATSYQWRLCDNSITNQTNASIPLNDTGRCCISLTAFNATCVSILAECFNVILESTIEVPNVFTPNGDKINDYFIIKGTGIKSLHCNIYNRWGELLFEWEGLNGGWNGNNDTKKVPDGTYYYIVNYTTQKDDAKVKQGFLTLFRD